MTKHLTPEAQDILTDARNAGRVLRDYGEQIIALGDRMARVADATEERLRSLDNHPSNTN